MREKVTRRHDKVFVPMSGDAFSRLKTMRDAAVEVMTDLGNAGIFDTFTYGSIVRGDVTRHSDIDIFIRHPLSSFKIELALSEGKKQIRSKSIVQATPNHAIKGLIELSEEISVGFPISPFKSRELEFFKFGGVGDLSLITTMERKLGVNKKLELVQPTSESDSEGSGHWLIPIIGNEPVIAKKLGISLEIVQERVRVLTRRDKIGRTGILLKRDLSPPENFEKVVRELKDSNPMVKRLFKAQKRR